METNNGIKKFGYGIFLMFGAVLIKALVRNFLPQISAISDSPNITDFVFLLTQAANVRRWDDVRRLVDLAKIKIGQVVYWRMDISTIVLVRIHTVSVSPDNTIEYSASSLYGDEISFTDELIGKEIFVDLQEVPEQDLFECRKKGEKLLWIEIQNKDDTHGL